MKLRNFCTRDKIVDTRKWYTEFGVKIQLSGIIKETLKVQVITFIGYLNSCKFSMVKTLKKEHDEENGLKSYWLCIFNE